MKINKYTLLSLDTRLSCLAAQIFWILNKIGLLSLAQFRSYICSIRAFTNSGNNILSPLTPEWQPTLESNKAIDTWKCWTAFVCMLWDKAIKDFCTDFPQERIWVPWEATHQLIKWNQAISCSELIGVRGQTDKDMPICPLPKNHSSKSVRVMPRWSHAYIYNHEKIE